MQDQIRELLGIIDDNSEHLPNGDYLNAMNLLNNLYNHEPAHATIDPSLIHEYLERMKVRVGLRLRVSINEIINEFIASTINEFIASTATIFDDFGVELMRQLRVPPAAPVAPDPPVPDIPDRRGLDNPNIPRQGGVPHFETREQRQEWILQNGKQECSLCHRIIARGDSRRHQQRQICEQTRARYGF